MVKVAPVAVTRDPETVASLTIISGAGAFVALLTEDERRALIEALGGQVI